jgi:hypothetical protein
MDSLQKHSNAVAKRENCRRFDLPACAPLKRERHAELLTPVETSFFNGVGGAGRPKRERG